MHQRAADKAIAIVGVGAVLPDARDARAFWANVQGKKYSIGEVPLERWDPADYFDPDRSVPDKTYSKIGGFVRDFELDWKRFRVPPKVAASMDQVQQWAVAASAEALADYGYPERNLDTERTGVVLGTAMGGDLHLDSHTRVIFPEFKNALEAAGSFADLPEDVQQTIVSEWHERVSKRYPEITEDTMPGELSNIVSGRVANLLNLRGPNFITDAACASSLAAISSACNLLLEGHCDAALTGGSDRNMSVSTFVKFSKIGALSATGSRPFGDGADGFVMGEGCAVFLLKRLADAERDGDQVYAVIRGIGESSDGKGKGITAPNPVGQELAIRRAWENAGLAPETATLVEAHGTSTKVGDAVELETLAKVFAGAERESIALGSAKSNIGHLKAAAGAAGLLKVAFAMRDKVLPPTLNAEVPNPSIDFASTPFFLSRDNKAWEVNGAPRRAAVSSYGFGGTNFHVVVEEHVPGALTKPERSEPGVAKPVDVMAAAPRATSTLRGILALGADTPADLGRRVEETLARVREGWLPGRDLPEMPAITANERLVVDFDFEGPAELEERLLRAQKALVQDAPAAWNALSAQGIFRGRGRAAGKVAFMFPGQGSQYLNMGRELIESSAIVRDVFAEADRIMEPILGKPLTSYIFVDATDKAAVKAAEMALMDTAITQPAMLTMDTALYQLLASYGFHPDLVMGHSLGEYGALIAAGIMPFAHALEATAARGREMTKVSVGDNGWMAAVFAPLDVVQTTLGEIDGYVVAANINSFHQSVIGGASSAVEAAIEKFTALGHKAMRIPVSHAFHTKIVAPAAGPLRQVLNRLDVGPGRLPVVGNVHGTLYPESPEAIKDLLEQQIASPVQWIKGLETLYAEGVRTFVEVGPKKALRGLAEDVLGDKDVTVLNCNHPKIGEVVTFNRALCGLYAAGRVSEPSSSTVEVATGAPRVVASPASSESQHVKSTPMASALSDPSVTELPTPQNDVQLQSLRDVAELLAQSLRGQPVGTTYDRDREPAGSVVVSGVGVGLPGENKSVMDPDNVMRLLRGESFIGPVPERLRTRILDKRINLLVKDRDGNGHFELLTDDNQSIKLAARPGFFSLTEEYGVPEKLVAALDTTTELAFAAGVDALREAGIPLVRTYRRASNGRYLPDRWMLPQALRDETGVIFSSAFPGLDSFAQEAERYYTYRKRLEQIEVLESLRQTTTDPATLAELGRRAGELRQAIADEPYEFDRRFIMRILTMGHAQFAEYIGARGPNTAVNAACASSAQAVALAEDWIRSGRCRRVVVIGADNVTGDGLMEWIGASFHALGAAATDGRVEDAALPFDRRRHGLILGMGSFGFVVESEDVVRERGMRGIVEVLATETRNSALHPTRLAPEHIAEIMNDLVTTAERRFGLHRTAMADRLVFVSHETYTPARGGSAQGEVVALRNTFGEAASRIVVTNTKGFTGHPMAVGVEDVAAVKILEHGLVPPIANFKEPDPELGDLNLSRGGHYDVEYSMHLGAGFGSQVALTLFRRIPGSPDRIERPAYQRWLADVSGQDRADLEVEDRTLRVVDTGAPARPPIASTWRYGSGPSVRASAPGRAQPPSLMEVTTRAGSSLSAPAPVVPVTPPAPPAAAPVSVVPAVELPRPEAPAPAPEPTLEAAPAGDSLQDQVMQIVAEKTGYPTDMLDLELDLEADLGIDTVKQAETFAEIRTTFDIPPQDDISLRDYPTLGHVVQFVRDNRPDLARAAAAQLQTAVVAAAPVPAASAPPAASGGDVQARVIAIVAEKTGYPTDMLDLDLDLEADLGIDTVKQAETFAEIRTAFDIPRDDNISLRDYPTLASVIGFVRDRLPASATAPAAPAPAEPAATAPAAGGDDIQVRVIQIVADKTGYPTDMLDLDLDLEADLGIDTVKQAETFAEIRTAFDISRDENLSLRDYPTLASVIGFVRDRLPASATAPASAAPSTAEPATTDSPAADDIQARVIQIVADKTGYPTDMLDLDLDLEADLGIDTVKQAETFAEIRTAFDISRDENLSLRDYPTLASVIGFVRDRLPAGAPTASPAPEAAPEAAPGETAPTVVSGSLADANRIPRRVPVPVVRPPLSVCKDTGVSLGEGSRVVVALDQGGVGRSLVSRLEKRGAQVLSVDTTSPTEEVVEAVAGFAQEGAVTGVYWLPALDSEPDLESLDLASWRELNRMRTKALYATMRALVDQGAFLVSATRLGGAHGYTDAGASAPLGGAVVGFTKAYKREQPEVLVKAVDFAPSRKTAELADLLVAETISDPAVVEVGYTDGQRLAIAVHEQPVEEDGAGLELGSDTVFVVTGAAGGITSAIVADLARASGGQFYLLDLAPAPERDDAHVALLRSDREALKRQLIDEAREAGERPTPKTIDAGILAVERRASALAAVEAVESAGGTAHYVSLDLRDGEAVAAAVEQVRQNHSRIDVLVHAGGLEISRALVDKETSEFDLVFDVKADGMFNLLAAARGMPIGATVSFSSVAGRFGNSGQTDYSAANDLLCKVTSNLKQTRPDTRGVVIDWTAWAGIGMATRGSIPAIMEAAGIDMLPPECGVPTVRRELSHGPGGELVVGNNLGMLVAELEPKGGLDVEAARSLALERGLNMIGSLEASPLHEGVHVETTLDPTQEPFLYDHQVETGVPYLPGVMGIETFAQVSKLLLPDYHVVAVRDVRFASPFKFYRNEPRRLVLRALPVWKSGGRVVAKAVLTSLTQPRPDAPVRVNEHFFAEVELSSEPATAESVEVPSAGDDARVVSRDDIYRTYFHGPAYQVLDRVAVEASRAWGEMTRELPANSASEGAELTAPRLVETCFQAAGIWEISEKKTMALPAGVAELRVLRLPEAGESLLALVDAVGDGESFDARIVDESGSVLVAVEGYRTISVSSDQALWADAEGQQT